MKNFLAIIFLSIALTVAIPATMASSTHHVALSKIELPETELKKELKSGLPVTIRFLLVSRSKENKSKLESLVDFVIIYDLWDEVFTVSMQMRGKSRVKKLSSVDNVRTFIARQKLAYRHPNNGHKTLEFRAVLNPVDSKKISKVQRWFANSKERKAEKEKANSNRILIGRSDSRGPIFQSLFDSILEQYSREKGVAGQWQSDPILVKVEK